MARTCQSSHTFGPSIRGRTFASPQNECVARQTEFFRESPEYRLAIMASAGPGRLAESMPHLFSSFEVCSPSHHCSIWLRASVLCGFGYGARSVDVQQEFCTPVTRQEQVDTTY